MSGKVWGRMGPGSVAAFRDSGTVSIYHQPRVSRCPGSSGHHPSETALQPTAGIAPKIKLPPPVLQVAPGGSLGERGQGWRQEPGEAKKPEGSRADRPARGVCCSPVPAPPSSAHGPGQVSPLSQPRHRPL